MTPLNPISAPITSTSAPTTSVVGGGLPVAGRQAPAGNSAINTGYSSTPANGGFVDELASAVANMSTAGRIVNDANNGMKALRQELTSEGGYIDNPAKLQDINWRMSQYEMQMQQAAKLQEKEERMASIWVRP